MEKIIGMGAEATLVHTDGKLIKKRTRKSYRIEILDEKLRKQRTKKEAKLLEKASKLISVPKIIKLNEKKKEIDMEFIDGKKLSEHLDNLKNAEEVCKMIGENIAKLHDADIIHGDLTTSNMIYAPNKTDEEKKDKIANKNNQKEMSDINNKEGRNERAGGANGDITGKVFFIDFGLGFESNKIEDKAVDLHLIKQALEAKHFNHFEKFFQAVLKGYKLSKHAEATINRLKTVEKRGRYKQSY